MLGKRIGKWLCKAGYHKWRYQACNDGARIGRLRRCRRCRVREHYFLGSWWPLLDGDTP